jgi:hypothetical protein
MSEFPLAEELCNFIQARESLRETGVTSDDILRSYRFCNVHRENDRVTRWLYEYWFGPKADHPDLIPAVLMGRLFNNPPSLAHIGFPTAWSPEAVKRRANEYEGRVFNPAYIVSTNGMKIDKVQYVVDLVLDPVFMGNRVRPIAAPDLYDMWVSLIKYGGVGSFIAAQVVADLKMLPRWQKAADYYEFVAPGPGSMRGLNRLRGIPAQKQRYSQEGFKLYIASVRNTIKLGTGLTLCAQNTQNCLCEFDKYMRAKSGEGKPKQKYRKHTSWN